MPALKRLCPVLAYEDWLVLCQLLEGPVFCGIDRWGHLSPTALHPSSVSRVLQRALARAGVVGERYSGHSLRRGFAIWATRSTSTATRRPAKKKAVSREEGIAAFWRFSSHRDSLTDLERLQQINLGFSADLIHAFRWAFDLQDCHLEMLLNASISTLERRRRAHKNLDPVASERLDRIATVSHLAEEIFETQVTATRWMSTPNKALGGTAPIMLCETEIGANQVRRVPQALGWGGPA